MKKIALAILSAAALTTGCANQIMSDRSIADTTAALLGQPASSLRISDRRYDGMTNTYYTATTAQGVSYRCVINGGTLLSAGMINPPTCNRG